MDRVVLVNMIGGVAEEDNLNSFELKDMSIPEVEEEKGRDNDQEELPAFPPAGKDKTETVSRVADDSKNVKEANSATPLKMNKNKNKSNKGNPGPAQPVDSGFSVPLLLCALVACMGGILGGFSHGFPSPTLLELQQAHDQGDRITAFPSNSFYAGLFGAIGPVGGLCGGAMAGPVADKIGRSAALVIMNVPHLIGWLLQGYAHLATGFGGFISLLMIGRWFTGLGTGWGSLVISVYIVEVSPAKLKGLFGSLYWFSTAIGILLVYTIGATPGFLYYNLSLLTAGLVVPTICCQCFLPETPRWLLAHQKLEHAQYILRKLRGKNADITTELKELQENFSESGKYKWRKNIQYLLERSARRALFISVSLMIFQQLTGTNVVVFYAGNILANARVVNPIVVAGYAVGGTQVIAVLVSVLLVDCVGRKVLLVISSVLVCVSTGLLGLYNFLTDYVCVHYYNVGPGDTITNSTSMNLPLYCEPESSNFFVLAIFSIVLFVIAFSIGWSTIPWVMMSELSPLRVRGLLSSIATFVNWTTASIITGVFPEYELVVKSYGSWWTLMGITLLSIPFVLILVPETKGKSLELIEKQMKSRTKPKTIQVTQNL